MIVATGPGGYGYFFLGSDEPMAFDRATIIEVLSRPGVLDDISSAYDSPATTVDAWTQLIPTFVRMTDEGVTAFAGDGPLITDDHPLPEYFLLHRLFGTSTP
jgi:hypothetical protein